MTAQTFALIASAAACVIAAIAFTLWTISSIRRAPLPGNGPMTIPEASSAGGSFHDYCLVAAMQGMLSHGETKDRNPIYIANRAQQIADYMVRVRRAG